MLELKIEDPKLVKLIDAGDTLDTPFLRGDGGTLSPDNNFIVHKKDFILTDFPYNIG